MKSERDERDIPGPEPRRMQRRGEAPGVLAAGLGIVDRAGRDVDPAEGGGRGAEEPPKGRRLRLHGRQGVLAQHRQARERLDPADVLRAQPALAQTLA